MEIPSEIPERRDDGDNLNLKLPLRPARPKGTRSPLSNSPIKPPYPWSTEHRAVVDDLNYLQSNQILTITGDVKCNQCDKRYKMEYDLLKKFDEIASFIEINKNTFHDKAPSCWMDPILPDCNFCGQENCVKPVISENDDNESVNWLFLLLGQFLACLRLEQLKYFCTHTKNLRSGAKNRLLYLTYLALCKQLQPSNTLFHV